jgi:hypothetical protein
MAYVSQEKKAKIAAALKPVVPKGWKYTLAVRNHTELVMTVSSAPVDVIGKITAINPSHEPRPGDPKVTHASINPHWINDQFRNDPKLAKQIKAIVDVLNTDNFDNSDIQTDYFHVGHYITLQFGRWDKPFAVKK